jgi:hypothetical protein
VTENEDIKTSSVSHVWRISAGTSSMSSEASRKTPLSEHVHAAVYNFGFVAAERYPVGKEPIQGF